jgi:hypothetical protein
MTYVAIRVLWVVGLAHSVKLPKLTPATPLLRVEELAGAIARHSASRMRSGVS